MLMFLLQLLLLILPLGLDTFGVSLSLGIKSSSSPASGEQKKKLLFPYWLRSATLFSLAEMLMPVVGLIIGYAVSLVVSDVMHYVGAVLLIGVGGWELWEEGREHLRKRKQQGRIVAQKGAPVSKPSQEQFYWGQQLLLALSISLDELAIGFSLGSITAGKTISPIFICVLIGLQGFLLTLIGLSLGRTLRTRLKPLKEWSELFSAFLLVGLGIWLLVS
jgi:manganese efflux pump family protein